jgi:hypothetical protein
MLTKEELESPASTICEPCKCSGSIKYIHKECLKVIINLYLLVYRNGFNKENLFNVNYVIKITVKSGLNGPKIIIYYKTMIHNRVLKDRLKYLIEDTT